MNLKKKIPLFLTSFRIFGSIVFLFLAYMHFDPINGSPFLAGIFSFLAFTDFLDGYFARKLNAVSRLGSILDPMADKILCTGSLIFLFKHHIVPDLALYIIIMRDIVVGSTREYAVEQNMTVTPSYTAKLKTFLLIILIALLFLYPIVPFQTITNTNTFSQSWSYCWIIEILWFLVVLLANESGSDYFRKVWYKK